MIDDREPYKYIDTGIWSKMLNALSTTDIEDLLQSLETVNRDQLIGEQAEFIVQRLKDMGVFTKTEPHEIVDTTMTTLICRCGESYYTSLDFSKHKEANK